MLALCQSLQRLKLNYCHYCFLLQNHHELVLKKQIAEDYYDLYVTQIVFKKFCKGIAIIKKELEQKWQKAVVYYNGYKDKIMFFLLGTFGLWIRWSDNVECKYM